MADKHYCSKVLSVFYLFIAINTNIVKYWYNLYIYKYFSKFKINSWDGKPEFSVAITLRCNIIL